MIINEEKLRVNDNSDLWRIIVEEIKNILI